MNGNECLGFERDAHAGCPSTGGTQPPNLTETFGPVPDGGGTVSHLYVQMDGPGIASGNTVQVLDNGNVVLSCTAAGTSSCQNAGSASVAAGTYLQVRVINNTGAGQQKYRVTFRF